MVIFWRGWGISVLYVWVAWMVIVLGTMIAIGGYEPDAVKAASDTDLVFAAWFALSAVSIFFLARYRNRTPRKLVDPETGQTQLIPHLDDFMFIPLKYWTHILAAATFGMVVKSFFE